MTRAPFRLMVSAPKRGNVVPFLRMHLRRAHRILRPALAELSVALVHDRQMSSLHKRYMGVAGPTDVLTFPLEYNACGQIVSGEIVLGLEQIRRQARAMRQPPENELLLCALHGMLHLCGFDDRNASDFKRMHQMEDTILSRLGVGPVFDPQARVPARPPGSRRGRRERPAPVRKP